MVLEYLGIAQCEPVRLFKKSYCIVYHHSTLNSSLPFQQARSTSVNNVQFNSAVNSAVNSAFMSRQAVVS
jgi:hypothetical protein